MEAEIAELKKILAAQAAEILALRSRLATYEKTATDNGDSSLGADPFPTDPQLSTDDIARYSRQIILPEMRVRGQLSLKKSSVLIVGCGGLGCPAALYLASAGIGRLGLVDYDVVEISNLHRQVLHRVREVNERKCDSAARAIKEINPHCQVEPLHLALDSSNAVDLIKQYDVVLDCSDNVATRYLLNDACVLVGKPLVSGSALRWEGQLTVYNYKGGPTYRCLFPTPPPPGAVTNCSDGGVVGMVPGVIGLLQALETVKLLVGLNSSCSGKLLLFDGLESSFRTVKLRSRSEDADKISQLVDYEQFCGSAATDKETSLQLLRPEERITVKELKHLMERSSSSSSSLLLLDVRSELEVEMCSLPGSINVPIQYFTTLSTGEGNRLQSILDNHLKEAAEQEGGEVLVICRRGNDSQVAVAQLRHHFPALAVRDVIGGLHAWTRQIDPHFPIY